MTEIVVIAPDKAAEADMMIDLHGGKFSLLQGEGNPETSGGVMLSQSK